MIKVGENKFKRYAWVVSVLLLLGTIFFAYQVQHVKFDYDFEKFYPTDDEDTKFFMDFREKFNSDNDFVMLAIPREEGVFDKAFLKKVDRFVSKLEKVKEVKHVLSITNQSEFFLFPGGAVLSKPYIDFNDFDPARDSARVFKNDENINSLVSKKGNALGIFVKHTDYIPKKRSDVLIQKINDLADREGLGQLVMSGKIIGQKYYIDVMSTEILLFLGLSAILIIVFLFIAFRSVWGIVVPQIVILLGMLWLIGGMGLFNQPINIILTVLPSIMFVVSMSDAIHLVSRYLDALRTEKSPYEAIVLSIREVGLATFLTSFTTAIGFLTLYFVRVQPIQVFGLVMGIGVMIAFVLTFLLLPILFYFFPGPKRIREKKDDHFWKKHLEKWFRFIVRRPKTIIWISVIVSIIGLVGTMRIEANNYLMDDINPKDPLKLDFDYIDRDFGGVRTFSLAIMLEDTSKTLWDFESLKELDTVQNYLEKEFGIQVRTSLISVLKVMNRGSHAGNRAYYSLPESERKIKSFRRNLKVANKGELLKSMIDSTERYTIINGTLPDIGNKECSKRNEKLLAFLDARPASKIKYRLTGSAYLVDKNIGYLALSMVQGLGLSIIIVALLMGIIYRSVVIMVISLIPNLIPLIVIAGIMGFVGVELKMTTAIIFTIAFGIAVDDTIHLLGKFKYEMGKGRGKMYALKRSYLTTGKAMILTTLILCAGFLLLVMSSFMGTFYMGILLCITLFVALIADLTLLPVLIILFYHPKSKQIKE